MFDYLIVTVQHLCENLKRLLEIIVSKLVIFNASKVYVILCLRDYHCMYASLSTSPRIYLPYFAICLDS